MSKDVVTVTIHGTPISPGMAQGIIHVHHGLLGPIDTPVNIEQHDVKGEFARLDAATVRISEDLFALASGSKRKSTPDLLEFLGSISLC